ncbi:MAG: cytochrome c [Bacteroidota bacterium]
MMKVFGLANLLMLVLILSTCQQEKKASTVTDGEQLERRVDIFAEIELNEVFSTYNLEKLKTVEVQFRPAMKKPVKYEGVPFLDILEGIYGKGVLDSLKTGHAIELICKDGYYPQMLLSDVWKYSGYLVDRMAGEPDKWPAISRQKYAPFYLVWEGEKNDRNVPWPYGLTSVRLVSLEKQKECLLPDAGKTAEDGFYLFKKYCMKCHSINGKGGVMGPELNYPKNILAYWQEDQLSAFVKSPQSFRYNHQMKPVKRITETEMESIIDYFKYIETHSQLCD